MMRRSLLFLLACSACATTPAVPEKEYRPAGEVRYYNRSASFDETRVRSVKCNLQRRADGTWGGVIDGRAIDVSVNDITVRGVDIIVNREESRPGKQVFTAQFQGRIFRFEISDDSVSVRTGSMSANYPGRLLGEGVSRFGPNGELELRGESSLENPPWPQLAFALIAAFI
jgi:hypothetical protein